MSLFDRAYEAGRDAARCGLPREACPYRDRRRNDGKVTYGRAWRKAWMSGWYDAVEEVKCEARQETGYFG